MTEKIKPSIMPVDLVVAVTSTEKIHINPSVIPGVVCAISNNRRTSDYRIVGEHLGAPHLIGFKPIGRANNTRFYTLREASFH